MQMDLIRQQLEFEAQHIRALMEERFGTADEMVQRAQVLTLLTAPVLCWGVQLPSHPILPSPALCTLTPSALHPHTQPCAPLPSGLCTLAPAICTLAISRLHPCTCNLHPRNHLFAPLHQQSAPSHPALCTLAISSLHQQFAQLHQQFAPSHPALCSCALHPQPHIFAPSHPAAPSPVHPHPWLWGSQHPLCPHRSGRPGWSRLTKS